MTIRAALLAASAALGLVLSLALAAGEGRAETRALQCSAGGREELAFSMVFDIDFDMWAVRRRKTGFPAYGPVPGKLSGRTMQWLDPTGGPAMALDLDTLKLAAAGADIWTCKPVPAGN